MCWGASPPAPLPGPLLPFPLQLLERGGGAAAPPPATPSPLVYHLLIPTSSWSHPFRLICELETTTTTSEDHDDPCQSIPMNPKRKRERFLTDAEFTRLGQVLDEVSDKASQVSDGAITTIRLLMLTGCRKTEIMTLRWQHVDLDRAEMRIVNGKTGDRTVHLSPAAVDVLAALPREPGNPWVVPGAKPGTHMADIDGAWQSIRAKAGLHDVRIHDIRHSFASRALALGEGLPIIGRLLGHRRVETTARYAHLARDSVRESAERIAVSIAADIM